MNGTVCHQQKNACGWTGIDVIWFRIGFVAAALMGIGFPVLLYLLIGFIARTA